MHVRMKANKEVQSIVDDCHRRASTMSIMNFEGLGNEDYQEDEGRENDMPIDPIWESQQISTFTAWCNAHLRKADMHIDSFEQDFRNGLKLMKLLEIISGETLPPPDKGRMRFHKIANVNKALKFIVDKGVKLASIGAEEIVDGNVKMTLGMIWTIILRFTIQEIFVEDSSAKEGLLLWCKRKTNGYSNIEINNFKKSFQNGLGFCALIHNHDPSLIDYNSLSPLKSRQNLELAFSTAETHLDIPQMLNIDDMVNNDESDERSIMAYVSSYYHTFNKRDKINIATISICGIVRKKIEEENQAFDCSTLSKTLLGWIQKMIKEFQKTEVLNDKAPIEKKEGMLMQYRNTENPEHLESKLRLQYYCILTGSIKEHFEHIQEMWSQMEKLKIIFEVYVAEQRRRLEQLDNLVQKFESLYQQQRVWINEQVNALISKDYETSDLAQLRLLKRCQETFLTQLGAHQTVTEKLVSIADELRRLKYRGSESIDKRVDLIVTPWDTLGNLHHQRTLNINKYYMALTEIDEIQLEFAQRVLPLYNWIQQSVKDLDDRFILHYVDEIKELVNAHENFKATLQDARTENSSIKVCNDNIIKIISNISVWKVPLNPYTDIKLHDIEYVWQQLQSSIMEREAFLRESLERQLTDRDAKETYTSLCVGLMEELQVVAGLFFDMVRSDRDRSQSRLSDLRHRLDTIGQRLPEASRIAEGVNSVDVPDIDDSEPHVNWRELSALHRALSGLLDELNRIISNTANNKKIVSPQKTLGSRNEHRECFRHFDKANCGQLEARQFHACLLSLGYDLSEDKENDKMFIDIMELLDPKKTGYVTFHAFCDWIERLQSTQQPTDYQEMLLQAFQTLSHDQRYIHQESLRQHLPADVASYCTNKMASGSQPVLAPSGDGVHGDRTTTLDYSAFVASL